MLRALTGVIARPFAAMAQNRKNNLQAWSDAVAEEVERRDQRRKAIKRATESVRWIALESGWGKRASDGRWIAIQTIGDCSLWCQARKEEDITEDNFNARAYVKVDGLIVLWVVNSGTNVYEPGPWERQLVNLHWPAIYHVELQCPMCDKEHEVRVDKGRIWTDAFARGVMCPECGTVSPPLAHDQYSDTIRKSQRHYDAVRKL